MRFDVLFQYKLQLSYFCQNVPRNLSFGEKISPPLRQNLAPLGKIMAEDAHIIPNYNYETLPLYLPRVVMSFDYSVKY